MRALQRSPFDTLEVCFGLLTSGPAPLALDGRQIGHGTPARQITLDDLRVLLHHPAADDDLKEAVLQELVRLATQHRGRWTIGLAGVLLPGLRTIARSAPPARQRVGNNVEADLLEQFHTAIQQPPLEAVEFAFAVLDLARPEWAAGGFKRPEGPQGEHDRLLYTSTA